MAESSASSRPRRSASAPRTCSSKPSATRRAWPTARSTSRGYRVPFLYSTNGEVIWFHDVRHRAERLTPRRAASTRPRLCEEMLRPRLRHRACAWFEREPELHHPRLRPYQVEANAAIETAIADRKATDARRDGHRHRQDLHPGQPGLPADEVRASASGSCSWSTAARSPPRPSAPSPPSSRSRTRSSTRSTRSTASGSSARTSDEDEKFDPKVLPASYLTNPKPKHAFVYVCTIQRMAINLFGRQAVWSREGDDIDDDADQLDIPHPRLRRHHRRRVPPRLHDGRAVGLARTRSTISTPSRSA